MGGPSILWGNLKTLRNHVFSDKVTTGRYNFVSAIWNSNPFEGIIEGLLPRAFLLVISAKTQFLDQVKINFISQLINDISNDLQKLLRYFSGTTISVSFLPTLFAS